MADTEHVRVFDAGKAAWDQWRHDQPEIAPDLSGVTAPTRDLQSWDFRRVDFSGADLHGSDLSGADLFDARLAKALLFDCILRGAKLRRVAASGANFLGAALDGCDLMNSDLRGADMTSTTLFGAALGGANCENVKFLRANCGHGNLASCKMRGANLAEVDLTGAELANADLRGANLSGANMSGADVRGVRVDRKCRFRGVRVEGSFGSRRFRRFAEDQDYLEELRSTPFGAVVYWIWLIVADCGRSFLQWVLSSALLCVLFGALLRSLDVGRRLKIGSEYVSAEGLAGYIEVSLRALMGIDVGQMACVSRVVRWSLVGESLFGFILLGGLVSILMNKLARRA